MAFRGRGGGGGGGPTLPFDIDTALQDEVAAYSNNNDNDDFTKMLYPDIKGGVRLAPLVTEQERELINIYREHNAAMRNGPLFVDEPKTGKRDAAEYNAFEEVQSYGNKKVKRGDGLPNLKKVPIVKDALPRELWDLVSDGEEDEEGGKSTKKNLDFLRKKRLDKLAQFDDGADVERTADNDDDEGEEQADEEDQVELPEDDDFSEDDDDLGNDYNAEKYFDDGDGGDDDGDDAGGDDAW
ncbi:hypothetical protein DOTSEDRAFT_55261 [Lecanosticta acicola]|uniref:DNA-directed RNA polymerase III subunit n=1 Tax=Lecanosticta acicola TaxID=111012 RepID=A0AAI8YSF9_9PEZI|nr:hypothetical protein DOTSEDRAFT_55261 [Lecanosticta acicola]